MPGELRAVIDTNVIVSAFISPNGPPAGIIRALEAGRFVMVTSLAINEEVLEVVCRPGLWGRYGFSLHAADIAHIVWKRAEMVVEPPTVTVSRDPKDDKILSAAVGGRANYIVTGDIKDLLSLGQYRGIRIVDPRSFLAAL